MKTKVSIFYSWFVRTITILLPNIPAFMRFRGFLYSLMMKKCGYNFQATSSVVLNSLTGLSFGDNVYLAVNVVIIGLDIEIGNNVIVGPNTVISGGNHTFYNNSFRFSPSITKKVIIDQGCWVAANCTITAGAKIPSCSILAAGAVLSKSMDIVGSIYGGVPAKYIKKI